MKKTSAAGLIIVLITAGLFFLLVPIQSEAVPDGCNGCYVQYDQPLSCQFLGIGDAYSSHIGSGAFWFGCEAPIVP